MFVILTYDVAAKRTGKILRVCRKYLHHERKSVFEGSLTTAKLQRLKDELKKWIVVKEDSVNIYEFDSLRYSAKEQIGRNSQCDHIL